MMKIKLVIYSLASFIIFSVSSCHQQTPDVIVFSGTIKNAKESFRLKSGYGFEKIEKTILLDKNGSFSDSLNVKEGLYYIYDHTNFPIPFYLKSNGHYMIAYDVATFDAKGILLEGDHININNYFIEKRRNKIFFDPYGEGMSEKEFRKFLEIIRTNQVARLTSSKLPKELREFEKKGINYEYLKYLNLYLLLNDIKDPSNLSKGELNIDYNNEQDFKKYGDYMSLLTDYYGDKLMQKEKKIQETNPTYTMHQSAIQDLDSVISNEYIKNKLIEDGGLYYLKYSDDIKATYADFEKYYSGNDSVFKNEMHDLLLRFSTLKKGTPSPKFVDYKNYNGGINSLSDFKGKYVYIDLWASWCGNCFVQMPYLKALEKEYHNKNIIFLGIADDQEEDWRKTINDKNLGGVQLLVNDDSFYKSYGVYGIPRYILIDPDGNIIDHNAPRPSDKKLKELFKSIGL